MAFGLCGAGLGTVDCLTGEALDQSSLWTMMSGSGSPMVGAGLAGAGWLACYIAGEWPLEPLALDWASSSCCPCCLY